MAGGLCTLAVILMVLKNRYPGTEVHPKAGLQRVHSAEEDEGDGEEGDEEDDGEEDDGEEEDDDDDDGEDGDDEGDQEGDGVAKSGGAEALTIKAFVALGDQVHSVLLPLDGIESWGALSQTIHETCEDSDVPDLPEHGIMHIVLNVDGTTVPVTGKTPLEELWRAKAIKVSITANEDADDVDATEQPGGGQRPRRRAK